MEPHPIRYAVLRDNRAWSDGVRTFGLELDSDGALTLARVPGPTDGKRVTMAGRLGVDISGIAAGMHGDVYIADTVGHRIMFRDGACPDRILIFPGPAPDSGSSPLNGPHGLVLRDGDLLVADSGNGRILVLRAATLEPRESWDALHEPTALAIDTERRIYVVGRVLNQPFRRVLRFTSSGAIDQSYANSAAGQPAAPFSIAIGAEDVLYVSDEGSRTVGQFGPDGSSRGSLPQPPATSGFEPRALAAHGARLYIADASSGRIFVFDAAANAYLGSLPGYRGPVAAMVVAAHGTLYVKPGATGVFHRFEAGASFVSTGRFEVGPLDAGEESTWERVAVDAGVPVGTTVRLLIFSSERKETGPTEADWASPNADAGALDALVSSSAVKPARRAGRYLWLRVTIEGDEAGLLSPRLMQVAVETAGETYLDYLPAIFGREDATRGFLRRLLALFRSEMGDFELATDELPRLFDPSTTPAQYLPWLATWLAFESPAGMDADALRRLLPTVFRFHRRRGTLAGLRQLIELYTGAHAAIFEAFHERRLWQLGMRSALGFDTGLPASLPDGMVVSGPVPAQQRYLGLAADYFAGFFRYRFATRVDRELNLDVTASASSGVGWTLPVWPPESWTNDLVDMREAQLDIDPDVVTVRWTGQVRGRYSEIYDFTIALAGGCRLWIDDELVIDNWLDPLAEARGSIPLSGSRWSSIVIQYFGSRKSARLKLLWSSRSQPKEVVPGDRLYSIHDDNVTLDVLGSSCVPAEHAIAGETVVGRHGPLGRGGLGEPLFADTAHLFTVLVPAGEACEAGAADAIARVIDSEKPAHTDYHLCLVEPRMRVGFQARVGIDAIVASTPLPLPLGDAVLGVDLVLGERDGAAAPMRVGSRAAVGRDTALW